MAPEIGAGRGGQRAAVEPVGSKSFKDRFRPYFFGEAFFIDL